MQGLKAPLIRNVLAEDLQAVFSAAREMAERYPGGVDAWEMVGEPDIGYCTDLPDRVVAFQKAIYLGIKAGWSDVRKKRESRGPLGESTLDPLPSSSDLTLGESSGRLPIPREPAILMGALALPPGPWLERAERNGLLNYTDAYNFHFYGHASDFCGVIRAHAKVAVRDERNMIVDDSPQARQLWRSASGRVDLPLWITECGYNTVSRTDFMNIERRELQASFMIDTARQALDEKRVSVFMPFILVHEGDGHAMTLSADQPLPAWKAYAEFTRQHPWPQRPVVRPPAAPNPIVVQWLPNNATTTPHKVSGTYRFDQDHAIQGEFRLYNFSDRSIRGRLMINQLAVVDSVFSTNKEIDLAPGEMRVIAGEFRRRREGYFQVWVDGAFVTEGGLRSPVYFGLEAWPQVKYFVSTPVNLDLLADAHIAWPAHPTHRATSSVGAWQGINGVVVREIPANGGCFEITELTGEPVGDPLFPPMASAALNGLPRDGFLILKLGQPMKPGHLVRVDLLDDKGQRFTIWENFAQSYNRLTERETWLNLNDFNVFFWGRCEVAPKFHPERVREIQLRFYARQVGERFEVELDFRRPR